MKIVKEEIKRIAFITLCSDDPLKIAGVDKKKWYNPDIEVSPEDYYELNLDQIDNVELTVTPLSFKYGQRHKTQKRWSMLEQHLREYHQMSQRDIENIDPETPVLIAECLIEGEGINYTNWSNKTEQMGNYSYELKHNLKRKWGVLIETLSGQLFLIGQTHGVSYIGHGGIVIFSAGLIGPDKNKDVFWKVGKLNVKAILKNVIRPFLWKTIIFAIIIGGVFFLFKEDRACFYMTIIGGIAVNALWPYILKWIPRLTS